MVGGITTKPHLEPVPRNFHRASEFSYASETIYISYWHTATRTCNLLIERFPAFKSKSVLWEFGAEGFSRHLPHERCITAELLVGPKITVYYSECCMLHQNTPTQVTIRLRLPINHLGRFFTWNTVSRIPFILSVLSWLGCNPSYTKILNAFFVMEAWGFTNPFVKRKVS